MVICMKCGQEAAPGEAFCRRCGAFLEWTGAPATPADAPPPVTPGAAPARPVHAEAEPAGPAVIASFSVTSLRVEAGGEASLTVEARNRGRTVDQVSIEVRGPAAAWAATTPGRLNLMPDTAGAATITFRPPRSPAARAGEYPTAIAVSSGEHPDAPVLGSVLVEVLPFVVLEAGLAPSVLRGTGATATRLQLLNGGNVPVELSLGGDDPEMAFEFRFDPPALRVEPGTTAEARVAVILRTPVQSGPERARPFRVVLVGGDGFRRSLDGTFIEVAPPPPPEPPEAGPALVATLGATVVRVEPGGQAGAGVEVANRSKTAVRVSLELRGPAAAWSAVEPSRLSLPAGGSATATITVRPPRIDRMKPGRYPVDVAAVSLEARGVSAVEHLDIDVLPMVALEAVLAPSVLRGRREASSKLTVANRGNAPAELSLNGDDPEATLQFRISPAKLKLKPGASGHATVVVRARGDNRSRADLARPFRVVGSAGDGSRQVVDGTFIQPAARGRRRWPWLIALGAVALAAALLVPNLDLTGLNVPVNGGPSEMPPVKCAGMFTSDVPINLGASMPQTVAARDLCLVQSVWYAPGYGSGPIRLTVDGAEIVRFEMAEFDSFGSESAGTGERVYEFRPPYPVRAGQAIELDASECAGDGCAGLSVYVGAANAP
jgi:hypothetical protein